MKQQPFSLRMLFILSMILSLVLLAACGAEPAGDPTPLLPPPNIGTAVVTDGAGETGVAPTFEPGQVVTSTAVSGAEELLQPTPTLVATATAAATDTPAATAVTDPPTQAVISGPLPPTSGDLLFLADGAFKRWNHNTRQVETLLPGPTAAERVRENPGRWNPAVGDLTEFSISADGKRAAVVRLTASEAVTLTNREGSPYPGVMTQHEVWFVDLVSGGFWRIVPRVDNLRRIALAPDARHVAFIGSSLNGGTAFDADGQPVSHAYFVASGGGNAGPVVDVAVCGGFCDALAWHPDNNIFVWHDREAVWMQNLAGSEPESLIQNRAFDANTTDISQLAVYAPIAWASNGRYLLLWKGGWEGGNRALFDIPTRALVDVPDTFVYVNEFATEVSWMPDDRLLVLRSETGAGTFRPQLELWRFQPEQNSVVREESALLSSQNLGAAGAQHLEDGRFAYVLFSDGANPEAGAYHLISLNETPERVNASPPVSFFPGAVTAAWSKDGSGVIITPADTERIYYGSANGEFLHDMTAVFGAEARAFHWLPEIVP